VQQVQICTMDLILVCAVYYIRIHVIVVIVHIFLCLWADRFL